MSATVHSHWGFIVDTHGDDLFAYGDKIMQALLDQEQCVPGFTDSAVAIDVANNSLEIEANTTGVDLSHAIATVQSCVRAALHETGVGTPEWPTHGDTLSVLLKDLRTEQLV